MYKLVKNKKSDKTKLKEVLKDIKETMKYWQHKMYMDVLNANRSKEIYEAKYLKYKEIYKIVKEKGISKIRKKEDREYFENLFYQKGFTKVEII
jgi:hypothetical protein